MVEAAYYILSPLVLKMMLILFRSYPKKKVLFYMVILVVCWISYLILLSDSGILLDFGFPPRMPLMIVIPTVIIIIIAVNSRFLRQALEDIPLHVPVFMQSFRILVELLIYATFLEGIFPQRGTFEGLNFDVVVGITAIFAGYGVYKGIIGHRGLLIWNIVSLGILTLTVYSFISVYYFTDFASVTDGSKLVRFPYLLLPSFLLPTAVFLHAFSIKQLSVRRKSET